MAAMLLLYVALPWPRVTLLLHSQLSTSRRQLPRELRLLIYGSTHKEVDLTGAHYELIRAMTGSVTLPPTRLLRGRLREIWTGDHIAAPELSFDEAKMLPIRVINTGAARALKAFAFDLEAARDVFTAHVRREVRPRVEALAKNRHFFAAEAHATFSA